MAQCAIVFSEANVEEAKQGKEAGTHERGAKALLFVVF